MPRLDAVSFDRQGWAVSTLSGPSASEGGARLWINAVGDELSLHSFDKPPNLPGALDDIETIRKDSRSRVVAQGGGIVSVEVVPAAGRPVLES